MSAKPRKPPRLRATAPNKRRDQHTFPTMSLQRFKAERFARVGGSFRADHWDHSRTPNPIETTAPFLKGTSAPVAPRASAWHQSSFRNLRLGVQLPQPDVQITVTHPTPTGSPTFPWRFIRYILSWTPPKSRTTILLKGRRQQKPERPHSSTSRRHSSRARSYTESVLMLRVVVVLLALLWSSLACAQVTLDANATADVNGLRHGHHHQQQSNRRFWLQSLPRSSA